MILIAILLKALIISKNRSNNRFSCAPQAQSLISPPVFCCFLSAGLTQRKAQTQKAREFHKKSIKEKAVHLSSLFSGEASSPHQVTMLLRVSAFLTQLLLHALRFWPLITE